MHTKLKAMTRGTYEGDAEHIETADDLDDQMHDKREVQRTNVEKLGGDKDDKETHQRKCRTSRKNYVSEYNALGQYCSKLLFTKRWMNFNRSRY